MKKWLHNEEGGALLFLAFIMSVLVAVGGMLVDAGNLYYSKSTVQDKVEAVALAAVQEIVKGKHEAERVAYEYAKMNSLINPRVVADPIAKTVLVEAEEEVPFYFANLFGWESGTVSGKAKARLGKTIGGYGFLPLAIEKHDFKYGQDYTLKYDSGDAKQGNFGALALGGTGASVYRENMKKGYNGWLEVGMKVSTETGNMAGPTNQGLTYRIQSDYGRPDCENMETAGRKCARYLLVPIIDSLDVNGRKEVEVVGFAAFYMKDLKVYENKQVSEIKGQFIRTVYPGEIAETDDPEEFGLYSTKLIN